MTGWVTIHWMWSPARVGEVSTGLPVRVLANQAWDTLIYHDPETFQLKPLLAISWKQVDDTTWDFTLRAGVHFHDGSPMTADDVPAAERVTATGFHELDTRMFRRSWPDPVELSGWPPPTSP